MYKNKGKKLEVKVRDLLKCHQQVVVVKDKRAFSATLAITAKSKIFAIEQASENNPYECGQTAIPIKLKHIKHIEIVQAFSGGGTTTQYAKAVLGLKLPEYCGDCGAYLSFDSIEDKAIVKALEAFMLSLKNKGIAYCDDLSAGALTIEVKVIG